MAAGSLSGDAFFGWSREGTGKVCPRKGKTRNRKTHATHKVNTRIRIEVSRVRACVARTFRAETARYEATSVRGGRKGDARGGRGGKATSAKGAGLTICSQRAIGLSTG